MLQNNSNSCSIIIDAMGGDFAPGEIIKGSLEAKEAYGAEIRLVGDIDRIRKAAELFDLNLNGIEIIPAYQGVSMDDSPSEVLKKKKNSSIYIGTQLASGAGRSAFISAGNTGAVMACSLFNIKRIESIARPAIAVVIPLSHKKFVLIDAGANMDCKPFYLKQFAIMGKIYSENIIGVKDPKVALINVGSEEKKGNELAIESYKLLKDCTAINFIGSVEGRELFEGIADVAVCDGFVGNVILKSVEGVANLFFGEIKKILTSSILTKISALGIKGSLKNMKKKFDYEEYGGAQLLGLKRPVIISHGSSKSKSIKNAVKVAMDSLKADLTAIITKEIKEIN
jgi:glycerol-3-phosphate acyltransferase PlsX